MDGFLYQSRSFWCLYSILLNDVPWFRRFLILCWLQYIHSKNTHGVPIEKIKYQGGAHYDRFIWECRGSPGETQPGTPVSDGTCSIKNGTESVNLKGQLPSTPSHPGLASHRLEQDRIQDPQKELPEHELKGASTVCFRWTNWFCRNRKFLSYFKS